MAAILVVVVIIWRMNNRPHGMGSGMSTNIFGPSTLSLFSGTEQGGGLTTNNPPTVTDQLAPLSTNTPLVPSTNAPQVAAPPRPRTLSTNLVNTNGPVTVIEVPSADLVQTPPGVTAAPTTPEAMTIEERLGAASAQGGDIQFSLFWNNYNDLDLHCIDPKGEEIWFNNRTSRRTHGTLDVDRNANFPFTTTPVENIFWPINGAPPGLYKIFVVYYAPHCASDPTPFTVRTVVRDWKTYYFKSTISAVPPAASKVVCTLKYDPQNPDPEKRYSFVR